MKNKKKTLLIIGILLTICITIGISYAWWKTSTKQEGIDSLRTSCIKLEMKDLTDAINLEKAFPLTDEAGEQTVPYKFKVTNTCNTGIDYNVNIEVLSTSTMEAKNIAVKLDSEDKVVLKTDKQTNLIETTEYDAKEAYHISEGKLEPNESREHEIRIWMDESAGNDAQSGIFSAKVVISGVQNEYAIYKEPLLHGADPIITGDLVPVIIEEDGKVLKANEHFNWYCYEDKEWANAVILVDKTKTYEYYEEIPEENIESYFVWIPKYRYKLWDLGTYTSTSTTNSSKVHPIEIEFGLDNTINDETSNSNYKQCTTPMTSGNSGQCHIDDWMTHPAFLAFNTNGFWVGKFETGYKGATNKLEAQKNVQDASKVIIKPNVFSWTNITIGNAYHTSFNYKRTLESHMMKNTEWGAAAYLSHSIYGTCTGNKCTEVRNNNSQNYITGVASRVAPNIGYNGYTYYAITTPNIDNDKSLTYPRSSIASTTLNNTGIFDMVGGAWDGVMGYMGGYVDDSGLIETGALSATNQKYYDKYINQTEIDFSKRILGDAMGEMGPFMPKTYSTQPLYINSWYEDMALLIIKENSWILRGGAFSDGTVTGVFAFSRFAGGTYTNGSYRIVLTPQEIKE